MLTVSVLTVSVLTVSCIAVLQEIVVVLPLFRAWVSNTFVSLAAQFREHLKAAQCVATHPPAISNPLLQQIVSATNIPP